MTRQEGGLDALNFFLADVRDGLGPYLAIYLLTVQKWDAASIGLVMSIGGIATILAQTPAGNFIDVTHYKRAAIVIAAFLVTACCLVLPIAPGFLPGAITQSLAGVASSIFAPGIAAITLGIMGPKAFTRRTGRNEAFQPCGQRGRRRAGRGRRLRHGADRGLLPDGCHGRLQHRRDPGRARRRHRPRRGPGSG